MNVTIPANDDRESIIIECKFSVTLIQHIFISIIKIDTTDNKNMALTSNASGQIGDSFQTVISSSTFQNNTAFVDGTMQRYTISPPAYEITISDNFTFRTEDGFFNINLGSTNYDIRLQGRSWSAQGNINPFSSFDGTQSKTITSATNSFTFIVTLNNIPANIQNPNGKTGDRYTIIINYATSPASYNVTFSRNKENNNTNINRTLLSTLNNKVLVPTLNIEGQTLVFGSDIGNVIFTINDQYQYYCSDVDIEKKNNSCEYYINEEEVLITVFNKCCPKIADVVIGEGDNLYDKLDLLFQQYGEEEIGVPLTVFYPNLFFYAMLKYILARLLYGNFDTKYLLQKYNQRFLKDLSESRFCGISIIFYRCVDNICVQNYDRYFK